MAFEQEQMTILNNEEKASSTRLGGPRNNCLTKCKAYLSVQWKIWVYLLVSLLPVVDSKRVLRLSHYFRPPNPNPNPTLDPYYFRPPDPYLNPTLDPYLPHTHYAALTRKRSIKSTQNRKFPNFNFSIFCGFFFFFFFLDSVIFFWTLYLDDMSQIFFRKLFFIA